VDVDEQMLQGKQQSAQVGLAGSVEKPCATQDAIVGQAPSTGIKFGCLKGKYVISDDRSLDAEIEKLFYGE
jgi:hypothetical protein